MRNALPLAAALSAIVLLGAAPAGPDGSVRMLMKTVVEPASTVVFTISGEADPENGPPLPVLSDARWLAAMGALTSLSRVADHMLQPTQHRPGPEWVQVATTMSETAAAATAAAKAHDAAVFTKAVDALGDTCKACHDRYAPPAG